MFAGRKTRATGLKKRILPTNPPIPQKGSASDLPFHLYPCSDHSSTNSENLEPFTHQLPDPSLERSRLERQEDKCCSLRKMAVTLQLLNTDFFSFCKLIDGPTHTAEGENVLAVQFTFQCPDLFIYLHKRCYSDESMSICIPTREFLES